jgi:hypothetical protein
VRESQSAFSDPKVVCSIAYIRSNFGWLPENVKLPLQESVDVMKNASEKLRVVKARLVKLCPPSCRQDPPEDITPEKIPLLEYASVTSWDEERYFSAYKHILSDRRQSITPENMEEILP